MLGEGSGVLVLEELERAKALESEREDGGADGEEPTPTAEAGGEEIDIKAAEAAVHPDYPPGAEAVLIVELEGESDAVDEEIKQLDKVIA